MALGLGVNDWSVSQCREQLMALSKKVFESPSQLSKWLGRLTYGAWPLATRVYSMWSNSAFYNSRVLEKLLRETFGPSKKLLLSCHNQTHVAVTATTESVPASELFTTYNKHSHHDERLYGWHQRLKAQRGVKVWEA